MPFSLESNKRTTSVTGNGYHKEIPKENGGKYNLQVDDESVDVIFRGLLNVNASDMHHD